MAESPELRPQRRRVHSRLQNLSPDLLTSILSFADGRSVTNSVAALVGDYEGETLDLLALAASRRALTDKDKEKIKYKGWHDVPWDRYCKAEGRRRFLIGERRLALEADALEARAASWYAEQEASTDWAGGRQQEWRTEADEETDDGKAAAAAAEAARVQAVCKAWGVVLRSERDDCQMGRTRIDIVVDSTPVASFGLRGAYRRRSFLNGDLRTMDMVLVDLDASMTPDADELALWDRNSWERDELAYIETAPVCAEMYSVDMTRGEMCEDEGRIVDPYWSQLDDMRFRAPQAVDGVEYSRDEARTVADDMRRGAARLRAFVAGVCLHGAEQRWNSMLHLQTVVMSVPDADLGNGTRAFVVVSLSERNTCSPDCYCEGEFGVKVDLVFRKSQSDKRARETVVLLESTMFENQDSRGGPGERAFGPSDFANGPSDEWSCFPAKTPSGRGTDLADAALVFGVPECCVGIVVRALVILADPDQATGFWSTLEEENSSEHVAGAAEPGMFGRRFGSQQGHGGGMRDGTFRYPNWSSSSLPKRNLFRFSRAHEDTIAILSDKKLLPDPFDSAAEATAALGQRLGRGLG